MTTVKLRLLDEVSCIFVGLHGDHLSKLYELLGYHVPGYFFQPLYKLGRWDGKVRYFQMTGKTYIYLLDRILPKISQWGYKVEVEDLRGDIYDTPSLIDDQLFAHIIHRDTQEPTILRPHQVELVNALIADGHGIGIAATSAGKTIMCAALCHAYGTQGIKTLTIVPSTDLVRQTKEDYNTYLGADKVGEYSGANKDIAPQHIVSTWQALKNNPKIIQQFKMIIVDECQGLKGKVLTDILTAHAAHIPFRFGVTGTLPKEEADQMAVAVAVGEVKYTVDAAVLIDKGILSNLHIHMLQLEEDMREEYNQYLAEVKASPRPEKPLTYTKFKDSYFPDYAAEKKYLQRNRSRIEYIADLIMMKRDERKGNVLCLVDSVDLARTLSDAIPGSKLVTGQDVKSKDRKSIYDEFAERDDLVVIATVHVAGTGLSINRIFNLFLVDIGKSFVRVIQAIGRALRKANDKNFANIWDIGSDLKYGKRHSTERLNYYTAAKYPHKRHLIKYTA